jgi:hypothetical protein
MDSRINQALSRFGIEAGGAKTARRRRPLPPPPTKIDELSFEQLLQTFLGGPRLQRAKEMDDALVSVSLESSDAVGGKVKEYVVQIDLRNRRILHDCQDWRNNMSSKNMCKHLGKFLMRLDEGKATEILRQVLRDRDKWSFVAPNDQTS